LQKKEEKPMNNSTRNTPKIDANADWKIVSLRHDVTEAERDSKNDGAMPIRHHADTASCRSILVAKTSKAFG
jgi:hypothetical protein